MNFPFRIAALPNLPNLPNLFSIGMAGEENTMSDPPYLTVVAPGITRGKRLGRYGQVRQTACLQTFTNS